MNQTTSIHKTLSPWIMALRPKTLIAGIIPILVGSLTPLSFAEIDWKLVVSALVFSVFTQISVNLLNDVLDFKKGKDTEARIGPIRVTQTGLLSQKMVMAAGLSFIALAFISALPLILKGGVPILIIVLLSLSCCYLYSGGPYPISYNGLGEVFVIFFYGFVAVLSSYYLQTQTLNLDIFMASLQIGFLATVLIAINNLRDIHEDSTTGKKTLAVRFGVWFGKWEITFLIFIPFLINFYWYFSGQFLAFFLPSTTILMGVNLVKGIWKHSPSRLYNRFLGESSLLLAIFGILLILGLHATY